MSESELSLTWHYVDYWADRKPDAEFLVFGEERVTWGEFRDAVDRTAKAFLDAGIEPGDRIVLISMARIEFLTTFMAANKVGAIWLGLSPKLTCDEVRYVFQDCQPKVLITLREYLGVDLAEVGETMVREFDCLKEVFIIGEPVEEVGPFAEWIDQPRPHLDDALADRASEGRPEDLALLMYTSGSTGKPKGVLHDHRGILASVAAEAHHFDFSEATRSLIHFPINHVAADVELGMVTLYAGGSIVMVDRFDATDSLKVIEQERITLIGQVPAMFLMQFATPHFPAMDWSHVDLFVWSGSVAPRILVETLTKIASKTGARLMNGYGSTELAGLVTYTAPDDNLDALCDTAGRVVPPFELRIVDDERREVPAGTIGEMAVRGPSVMRGYLNKPDQTAAVTDAEGWFYTSDLAWLDDNGRLHITGRKSEMFKSGGENVYPREVEDVLEAHPDILLSAVIGVRDAVYQEVGHAFVMPKPGKILKSKELRAYCKQHLANFKVPKHIEFREALPILGTGKVNKVALKDELNGS
ncbi:MAG: acyl--CoA ligase [bacterium]|nr:acyl--CoA ligase [bacterium]